MRILNIVTTIPSPCQKRENDVNFVIAQKHNRYYAATHEFVKVIPYANALLGMRRKWSCYYNIRKARKYTWNKKIVYVISVPTFSKVLFLRGILNWVGFEMNKRFLYKICTKFEPNIIHAHNVHFDAYIARRLSQALNVPYVVTSRGIQMSFDHAHIKDNIKEANAVISLSYCQKNLIDGIRRENSYLLPHGIDEKFLRKQRSAKGPFPRLVTIGRLLRLKNIERILYALDKIEADFVYHIYGDGPDLERLKKIHGSLRNKDKVIFMGFVEYEKVPEVLSQHDIFILPSYPETFGRVFLEAMAVGLAVIAAKDTGIDGYILNEESGLIVSHTSIEEINAAICKLFDDKYCEIIGGNAKQLAREFSWENIIDRLNLIYNTACLQLKPAQKEKEY